MSGSLEKQASSVTVSSSNTSNYWSQDALTIHTSIVDEDGNRGHTLERPELPCLVFFIKHDGQEGRGRDSASYMQIQSTLQSADLADR